VARTPSILVIADDTVLGSEVEEALVGARQGRVLVHRAKDLGAGLEVARNREPDLVLADSGGRAGSLRDLVAELASTVPDTLVAAAFDRADVPEGEAESAFLLEALRAGVRDVLRRPIASHELRALLERVEIAHSPPGRAPAGRVVAFVSNKGGVGKSTLATNLACVLARRHPDEVLLLDAAFQLGACGSLLDLEPLTSITDAVRERDRLDRTLLRQLALAHDSGLRVLAAPADAVEASEIDDESLLRIVQLARRSYRTVVVDTFPLFDSTVMTLLDVADRVYMVLQGTVPDVIGAARYLRVLERLGVASDRLGVVLNRNQPGHTGRLGVGDVERRLERGVDHVVPYRKGVLVAQNAGRPYVLSVGARFGFGPALGALADEIDAEAAGDAGGPRPVSAAGPAAGLATGQAGGFAVRKRGDHA